MADFNYVQMAEYEAFGFTLQSTGGAGALTGTITNDNAFLIGEGGPTFYMWGTATVDGIQMPVFADGTAAELFVYNPGPTSVSWPATLTNYSQGPGNDYYYCFTAGTLIATPVGDRRVETLTIGDPILTADSRSVAVKWIGRQTVHSRFAPAARLMPVRFSAGSLGPNVPHTDLTVTADHGMLVDGVICHAGALVNGSTVTRVPLSEMGETFTVYHIETEAHEIILANGAPAETFIDNVSRRAFDNFAEFEALYGEVPEMEELPYPRAMSARQVPALIRMALHPNSAAGSG